METITKLMKNNLFTWLQTNLAGGAKTLLMVAAILCGVSDVWGNTYTAKLTVTSANTAQGKVYVYDGSEKRSSASLEESSSGNRTFKLSVEPESGYQFKEWTNKTNIQSISETQAVVNASVKDGTVEASATATFKPITYNITYNGVPSEVSNPNPSTYNIESNTITFSSLTRTGYTFSGWNPVSIPKGSTGDKSTTASWTANKYNVTYDAQEGFIDGKGEKTIQETYDGYYTCPTPTRDGYDFQGWFTATSGGGTQITTNSQVKITTGQTLYAHWQAVNVIIHPAEAQSVSFTARTETKTATLTFPVENATSISNFSGVTSSNPEWEVTGASYSNNLVSVTLSFTATENTTTRGNHESTITLTGKNGASSTGTVTASVHMTPVFTDNVPASKLVDDAAIDLNTLWTSTSNGTKEYKVTTWTAASGSHSGTPVQPAISGTTLSLGDAGTVVLELKQSAGTSSEEKTATHTLTINRRDNTITASYAGSMYLGATQNVTISSNNTNTPIVATQTAGNTIATLNDAQTQVTSYAYLGTATWTLSQAETYKYKAANNVTMSINVVQASESECYVLNEPDQKEIGMYTNPDGVTYSLDGPGKILTLEVWKNNLATDEVKVYGYDSNNQETTLATYSVNNLSTSPVLQNPIDISTKNIVKIKIQAGGTLNKHFKNVKVTRNKHVTPASSITIDKKSTGEPIYVGEEATGTLHVDWSMCNGGTLKLISTNPKFTPSLSSITEATDGTSGSKDITVSYHSATADTDEGKIVIYNDVYRKETAIIGITQKKTPSMSWWTEDDPVTLSTQEDPITNPVIDLTDGCDYTVSASAAGYVTIDNTAKTITPVNSTPAGEFITLTATVDNDYYYGQITKQIAVTNLKSQTIDWNQSFTNLKVGDEPITLTATAKTDITYQSSNTSVITVSGNQMTIVGKGSAYVVATAAADAEYAQEMAQKAVIVRNPGESCAPYEATSGEFRSGHDLIMQWDFPATSVSYTITKPTNVGLLREATIQELYDNSWHTIETFAPSNQGTSHTKSINIKSRAIRVTSDADNNMTVNSLRVDMTQYLNLSPSSLSMTATTTSSSVNNFSIDYSNIQGPLEYTSDNPYISFSPTSGTTGDCGEWGSATINVTYAPAEVQDGDYTITVWDGKTASLKKTITVHCKATAPVQTMTWDQTFGTKLTTDLITFNASTDAVRTDENPYPVVYTTSDASVATVINGNQLNILKSGTVTVTASQDGKDGKGRQRYNAVSIDKAITIEKATPTVTFPTATTITYGTALSNDLLIGGTASVPGSFAWVEVGQIKSAGKTAYDVIFTPNNVDWYNTITQPVTITINKANQTITWETETNINFDTPSASVLNATTTGDGSIVYTIDGSSDAGVGTITNNVLTLNKGGKLVINANAAATTNFNAATQVQKTFMVGKWGVTITWEDKDESGQVITTHAAGSGDIGNHFVARDEKTKEVVNLPITITNSDNTSAISIRDNKLYVDCAGTATITAQTATTDQYGAGLGTITLTSQINTPVFTWQIPQPAPNTGYTNFFTSSNTETDCILTFTSSDPTLAKVEGGKLIVGGDAQTDTDVTFTVTQTGNCRWEEHTETFTIHIKKPANHVPFTITESNYGEFKTGGSGAFSWDNGMKVGKGGVLDGGMNWDDKTFILHFSGIPDKLSFSYNCTDVSFNVTNAEWFIQESADGQTWSAKNVISSSTSTSEQHLAAPIQLSPTTRYITFCYSGNFAGVFKNINVTELKYFYAALTQTATEHVSSVDMGVYSGLGKFPVEETIYLRHANAGSDLQITIGDTKNFRLEHNISTGTDQMGDDPITIIYEPDDFGIHNTTLTIHDGQNSDIVISVNAAAQPGATYTFIGTDGDAGKLENWQVGGITPSSLPNAYHTVVVQQPMVISKEMSFYYLDINNQYPNAKVTIAPTGGLTIGQSGIRDASADRLIIQSSIEPGKEGQGYLRISPKYTGAMPQVTAQFATRSTLSTGANKDATWQYFGVPGEGGIDFTVDGITWLYDWQEKMGWVPMTGTNHLEPFHGYVITQYGQPTYNFVGKMTTENQDITLTYTPSGMGGSNIFANSYTAPIEVKNFTEEDFEGDIDKTFYLYNAGSWNQWKSEKDSVSVSSDSRDNTPGTYYAIPALSAKYLDDLQQTTIPSLSGVFVIAHEDGAKIHLNYRKHVWNVGAPVTDSVAMHRPLRAPQRVAGSVEEEPFNLPLDTIKVDTTNYAALLSHRVVIRLTSENSGYDRITLLEKTDDSHFTAGYDNGYDAQKIPAEGIANIYTTESEGNMAVSATNKLDGMYLGVLAGEDETYHLRCSSVVGDSLYLLDMVNGVETRIIEGMTYSFNASANSQNDRRFMIMEHEKKEPSIVTANNQIGERDAYIWTDPINLHIENASSNAHVRLYAADGKLIYATNINRTAVIPINDLPNSVYMVQIGDKTNKFIKK